MTYGLILSDYTCIVNDTRNRIGLIRNYRNHRMATFLREHGYSVDVVDFLHNFKLEELFEIIQQISIKNPLFIAVGVTGDKKYADWAQLIEYIKQLLPNTKVIIFGEHVLRLGYEHADFYIEGFAETVLLKILKNQPVNFNLINNCKFAHAKDYPNDLESNSFSSKYLESDFVDSREAHQIFFSYGCIFQCSFCNHIPLGVNKRKNQRPAQAIIDEILYIYNNFKITKFWLSDGTFNDSREKTDILLEAIKGIPEQLEIVCFLRLDLLYYQPGLIDQLVSAGVKAVHFGIDSWNPDTGPIIHKKLSPALQKELLIDIKQRYPSLLIYSTFIAGLPKDTIEQQYESLEWLHTTQAIDAYIWFPLSIKHDVGHGEVLSLIEQDFSSYGYTAIDNNTSIDDVGRNVRDRVIKVINWKNENFSLNQATELCNDINRDNYLRTKRNPWMSLSFSVVYKDWAWWLSKTHQDIERENAFNLTALETVKFIDDYKTKKLNYFCKNS